MQRLIGFASSVTAAASALLLGLALVASGGNAWADETLSYGCLDAGCTCPAVCPTCTGGCRCVNDMCVLS